MWPSSEIYNGLAGFFDYGPVGARLKRNIEEEWRKLFIIKEGMFEIETPTLMGEDVFTASGHLDHFTDPLVECAKCGETYRADHVVKNSLEVETDGMGLKELNKLIKDNKLQCKKCKQKLGDAWTFNLMFKTQTGAGKVKRNIYLRPETAQGAFVSFQRLYQVARKRLPFGACQIGKAYRNEISPRQGMIRLREFSQAEAEIFFDPKDTSHPNFKAVKNDTMPFLSADYQEQDRYEVLEMNVGDAVKKGVIGSEIHAYYLAISEKFFENLGIPRSAIRCREQLKDERAHYSSGTWDIEIKSEDFGWIEVAAIANRTDYDLGGHSALSKQDLSAVYEGGGKFTPHVIEASFGIDRPFYCVVEHSFREEEKRTYFAFDKKISPVRAAVFPLVNKEKLPGIADKVFNELIENNILAQLDTKGSIGRRYARSDEIGIPYCITVDFDSQKDNTVTLRERDTTKQKRVKIKDLVKLLK
jgi:glycyl-tRNA synthetase